jgi:hypothetical protein
MTRTVKLDEYKGGQFHKVLKALAEKGERVLVEFQGARLAIIPADDLALLERLEEEALDQMDAQEANEVLGAPDWVPWNQVKQQLK